MTKIFADISLDVLYGAALTKLMNPKLPNSAPNFLKIITVNNYIPLLLISY